MVADKSELEDYNQLLILYHQDWIAYEEKELLPIRVKRIKDLLEEVNKTRFDGAVYRSYKKSIASGVVVIMKELHLYPEDLYSFKDTDNFEIGDDAVGIILADGNLMELIRNAKERRSPESTREEEQIDIIADWVGLRGFSEGIIVCKNNESYDRLNKDRLKFMKRLYLNENNLSHEYSRLIDLLHLKIIRVSSDRQGTLELIPKFYR